MSKNVNESVNNLDLQEEAEELCKKGTTYYEKGDVENALRFWKRSAQMKDSDAMLNLAVFYDDMGNRVAAFIYAREAQFLEAGGEEEGGYYFVRALLQKDPEIQNKADEYIRKSYNSASAIGYRSMRSTCSSFTEALGEKIGDNGGCDVSKIITDSIDKDDKCAISNKFLHEIIMRRRQSVENQGRAA